MTTQASDTQPAPTAGEAWELAEPQLRRAAGRIIADSAATGVQVALITGDGRRHGLAVGRDRDGAELTNATRFPLVSQTKPITAVLLLELLAEERIDLHTPVAGLVPAFAARGKDRVTIHQLLTHTGGMLENRESLEQVGIPFHERFGHLCQTPLYPDWDPAADAAYSLRTCFESAGYLVEYLGGVDFADHYDETLGKHLGTLTFVTDFHGRQREAGLAAGPWTVFTQMPTVEDEADVPSRGFGEDALRALAETGSPSAGAVGSAEDVCALWWHIGRAAAGDGGYAVSPAVARLMTTGQRGRRHDRVLGFPCDYGYGVMTGLADYRPWGFPAELTPRSFAHIGLTHFFGGYCPEWDAAFALVLNGRTVKAVEFAALRSLFSALATGFAAPGPSAVHPGDEEPE
jgi:CubicO group peptidase (beta-lactamase class C family)